MATHVYDDGEAMVISYHQLDKDHLEFRVVPERVAIAKKFITNMGVILKYERLSQRNLTASRRQELDRLRKEQDGLVRDYEKIMREERWTRS